MAQKTLNAFVVIGGRVDNSFGQIGSELIALGSTVDEISSKLLHFGEESVEVYSDYQYNMKQVEGIWGSNGTFARGSRELSEAMTEAEAAAAEWAANSIFHTNDISNAMVEAAHAGWDLQQMLGGIPYAMKLAQAGDMDLSTSLNYVLKSMQSLGMEYVELPRWVDEWVYAANRSAGTAQEFGDTMLRMGSTMRFAEDPEELLALTKIMHDMGATGSEAGTMVRNSMLRILAPSGVASKVLAQLGATQEEIDSVMEDSAKKKALNDLEAYGFSAFDENLQAKPILQIYSEIGTALADMSGGWDNIVKNQKALGILSNIFGSRAATGAINIVSGLKEATELYEELKEGAAEGAAQYMSDTMMDSLYGKTEIVKSKWEELERIVGQQVAPQVETIEANLGRVIDLLASGGKEDNGVSSGLDFIERVSVWVGDMAENIGSLDSATFDGLVAGLGTIATLGPGMIVTGSAIRLLSWSLGTPAGKILLAATAITTLAEAASAMNEADFKGAFGKLSLNEEEIKPVLQAIHDDFMNAYTGIDSYRSAIVEAGDAYTEASTKLSETALTDMLIGKELTDDDLKAYYGYGDQMVQAVLKGLKDSNDLSADYWRMLASENGEIDMSKYAADPQYQSLIETIDAAYESSVGRAREIGQGLRDAITEAFADGKLTSEEYENILSYFNDLNEKMVEAQAQAKNREAAIQREMFLHKAQTLSYDSMNDFIQNDIVAQRQTELDKSEEEYAYQRAKASVAWDEKIASTHGHKAQEYVRKQKESNLQWMDEQHQEEVSGIYSWYDEMILNLQEPALHQSEFGEADVYWSDLVYQILSGDITQAQALAEARKTPYWQNEWYEKIAGFFSGNLNMGSEIDSVANYYLEMLNNLGGQEEVEKRIAMYRQTGQATMADRLQMLVDKSTYLEAVRYYNELPKGGQTLNTYIGNETWVEQPGTKVEPAPREPVEPEEPSSQAGRRAQQETQYANPLKDVRNVLETEGSKERSAQSYLMGLGEALEGIITPLDAISAPLSSEAEDQITTIWANLNTAYDLDAVAASMGNGMENNAYKEYFAMYDLLYGDASRQAWKYARAPRSMPTERTEIAQYMRTVYERGNVDLTSRPQVLMENGDFATVLSTMYSAGPNEELGYDKNVIVHVTPITEEGRVLSAEELNNYVDELLASGDALEADKTENGGLGLVLWLQDVAGSFEEAIAQGEIFDVQLHAIQEAFYGSEDSPYITGFSVEGAEEAAGEAHAAAQKTLDDLGDVTTGTDVTGGAAAAENARSAAQRYADGHPINFKASMTGFGVLPRMAKGGRETRPSIFAEAGIPEWYIPEEHTDNTLGLIWGATERSGFSIMDLVEYAGADMYAEGGTTGEEKFPIVRGGKGGRGTKPSIFAEADVPEWFIPERHDDRTLNLLLGATANSGFTVLDLAEYAGADMYAEGGTTGGGSLSWGSLGDSSGGSGGGSGGGDTIQVQYSPVIHTDNAEGVERVLRDDKKRIKKALRELLEEKELYGSVVNYR